MKDALKKIVMVLAAIGSFILLILWGILSPKERPASGLPGPQERDPAGEKRKTESEVAAKKEEVKNEEDDALARRFNRNRSERGG